MYVLMWGSRNSIELAAEAVHKLRRLASEAPVHLRPFQERAFGGPDEGKRVDEAQFHSRCLGMRSCGGSSSDPVMADQGNSLNLSDADLRELNRKFEEGVAALNRLVRRCCSFTVRILASFSHFDASFRVV